MPYKIVYDKKACIGSAECETISKQYWKVNREGKAELNGSTLNQKTGKYELIITDNEYEAQKKAAGTCPVSAIRIEKC